MPGSGQLSLTGTLVGFSVGQRAVNVPWAFASALDDTGPMTLNPGDNLIIVPGAAQMMLIEPPSSNAVAMTLKGSLTDTGITLHRTFSHWQSLDATVNILYLNVAQTVTPVQVSFF